MNRKILILFAIVIITVLVSGCAVNNRIIIPVTRNLMDFQNRTEKLPFNVGLFLEEKDKQYIISSTVMVVGKYDFMIGEALQQGSVKSLKEVFKDVTVIQDKNAVPTDVEKIINISFGPKSRFVLGAAAIGKHTADVELVCKVYDKDWNLLWQHNTVGNVRRATLRGLVPGGAMGAKKYQKAVGDVMNESLIAALEQLNEQIMMSGKNDIYQR